MRAGSLRAAFRRRTLRARLTLVYGAAFLVAGVALVAVMYLLVWQRVSGSSTVFTVSGQSSAPDPATGLPGPGGQFQQALHSYNEATLTGVLIYSLLAVLVLLLVAAAVGWLIAGRTLRPLQEITATARRVADRNLHERIELQGPQDELKELADTFDAMLERLDRAFVGQRRFVADASHELRTPLAINRTLLEVALGDPDASPDLRRLGQTLLATNERSERLIDGLLTLASTEQDLTHRVVVDLADVTHLAIEQLGTQASEYGVRVHSRLEPAPIRGDATLLERLALNLVQNGLRHNHPGGWVEVVTGSSNGSSNGTDAPDGGARLVVSNTGPVVPAHEVESLFQPFRRLHTERTGSDRGVGLGLSIVRSITRAHGGSVKVTPRDGGGLVVHVALPELG
jgi:signal transduction histidine kinase